MILYLGIPPHSISPGQRIASFGTGSGGVGTYNLTINNGTTVSLRMTAVPVAVEQSSVFWVICGANCFIDQVYSVAVNAQTYNVFDARGAVTPVVNGATNPVIALNMNSGHVIDFAGGASLQSAPQRYLTYSSTNTALEYHNTSTKLFSVSDTGSCQIAGIQLCHYLW